MAEHIDTPLRSDTYAGFMRMVKVGSIIVALLAAVVIALIAS
ncbi:aa3-type cytochrome c oxidase subunit IV [Sphingomonas sp.]|nr:aa3-type cytochrome c oxidase subunit IV [Sphingomonas sp.]HTG37798.1 aa3-type cytochrome c oxidase subunit IV [Sphingomonas sp.]